MEQSTPISGQLLETWAINNRINLYFLDNVAAEALNAKVPKARSVGGLFAHIHSVRLMWIKAAAPHLLEPLQKLEGEPSIDELKTALAASGEAIAQLLAEGLFAGRIKNFKPHPAAFLGYLISHESHHRGQAEIVLRQLGHPISDKAGYGLWEWGVR